MRYQIEEKDLDALLAKRANRIGSPNMDLMELLNGCIVALTAITVDYFQNFTLNIAVKTGLFILGTASVIMELVTLHHNRKEPYTVSQLKQDIASLNKVQKNYSILAIKDSFDRHPNHFLQYYDEGWNCWFFLNYPTMTADNELHLSQRLQNELGIDSKISLQFKGCWSDEKYSTEHKEWRVYFHELYEAQIDSFPQDEQSPEFMHGGRHYRWMTLDEMAQDPQIQAHNMDVVTRVKEHID